MSLLSLTMGLILMCVYTLHSSRPGRPPKRSYGAGVQESPRILHHRANSLLSPALLSPTGKRKRTHTRLVFHHVQCAVNLDEPQFTHSQPPSTHMKSICLNHSLLCCPSAHLSFSLPFCRSVRSSFMHLLLRVTVMNDTPQRDHSSICSSLSISLFLSLARSLTSPVLAFQIYCITLGRVDAENVLKFAPRNVLFLPESGV